MQLNNVQILNPVHVEARDGVFVTETLQIQARQATTTTVDSVVLVNKRADPSTSPMPSSLSTKPTNGLPDLNISNGTCYYAPGKIMDSGFIPCGNAAAGIQMCCWAGDLCYSDSSCVGGHINSIRFTVYWAGCTDSGGWNMSDPGVQAACPAKPAPYENEPWIGLVSCGLNNSTHKYDWIGCPQPGSPTTLAMTSDCTCPTTTQQSITTFNLVIETPIVTARLPKSAGGSIEWYNTYTPTYAVTATENLGKAPTTASTTTPMTAPTTALTASSGANPSSVGSIPTAKSHKNTGLIAGVTVGVFLIVVLALVGAFVFMKKRKQAQTAGLGAADEKMVGTSMTPGVTMAELGTQPARPWSLRSELDGTGTTPPPGANSNPVVQDSIGTVMTAPSESPTPGSVMFESSTVSGPHGQQTGQTTEENGTGNGTRNQHPGATNFETLVELEG